VVKPGRVLFEMAGVPEADARQAFKLAQQAAAHHQVPHPEVHCDESQGPA